MMNKFSAKIVIIFGFYFVHSKILSTFALAFSKTLLQ